VKRQAQEKVLALKKVLSASRAPVSITPAEYEATNETDDGYRKGDRNPKLFAKRG
jgi:hypothetical protein